MAEERASTSSKQEEDDSFSLTDHGSENECIRAFIEQVLQAPDTRADASVSSEGRNDRSNSMTMMPSSIHVTHQEEASPLLTRFGVREFIGSILQGSGYVLNDDSLRLEEDEEGDGNATKRMTQDFNKKITPSLQPRYGKLNDENERQPQRMRSLRYELSRQHSKKAMDSNDTSEEGVSKHNLFLHDNPEDMTYGRRIALHLMSKPWYNPRAHDDDIGMTSVHSTTDDFCIKEQKPSLEKAWAYFEHVALSRYVFVPKEESPRKKKSLLQRIIRKYSKGNKQLDRAEPGEDSLATKLYDPIFTPHNQLGDWGLGIGVYFSALRALTVICLVCGIFNIPNIVFYASNDYSDGQSGVPTHIKGSAICTETKWVPCSDCVDSSLPDSRLANATIGGIEYTFALMNQCDGAQLQPGLINFFTLLVFVAGLIAMGYYLDWIMVKFDEDEQTTQDYSMIIRNPPGDATDPEEWRAYFAESHGARLSTCTVGIDNDFLVRTLVERREVLRKIELALEPGTSMDTLKLASIAADMEDSRNTLGRILRKIVPGVPEYFGRLVVLTARVQGLAQRGYPATNVFVTFETEADQRRCLEALSVGRRYANRNITSAVKDPKHLFRGERVLKVEEADEPNTIRWQDVNVKFKHRLQQQLLTVFSTFVAIVVITTVVNMVNNASSTLSAYAIAIFNASFPQFARLLTCLESHPSEGSRQTSFYFKIALFHWANTAIVITVILPFTSTLTNEEGLVEHVAALFVAEIVTTNFVQFADPVGHLHRHVLAPRAKTQDAMNLHFRGLRFDIAERYTNMTKMVFLTVWYCAIYPVAFFMCAVTLLLNYFMDRFSLMRTWERPAQIDTRISQFSRRYFFSLAVVAMAVISSYYWSGFPYDNLCASEETVDANLIGSNPLTRFDDPTVAESAWLTVDDVTYKFCNQDVLSKDKYKFPFTSAVQGGSTKWMTSEQEDLTDFYGNATLAVVILVCLLFVYRMFDHFRGQFISTYEPCGEDQRIDFSDVPSINAYVPQVNSKVFSFPLLAACIQNIDPELLEWTDPDRPHSYYDLTKDADKVLQGMDVSDKVVFSQIKHWPAAGKDEANYFHSHETQETQTTSTTHTTCMDHKCQSGKRL